MFSKICVPIIILFVTGFAADAQAAAVQGTVYAWSDFDRPLKNVIIEVNSTPAQIIISKTGAYNFTLSPGNYLIRAKYYRNNALEYIGEEEIQIIDKEGEFDIDLLLFPPTESEYEYLFDINLTDDIEDENNIYYYMMLILIISFSGSIIVYWFKMKSEMNKTIIDEHRSHAPENMAEGKNRELPEDLRELYDMTLKMGGRVTQKDLRKAMACSEAKVSLMIADLEDRGLIKKIKKGRSNIIITEPQK